MSTVVTEHPNATTVRGFYEALGARDLETVSALLSPDVTILMPGRSPLAGLYSGRDATFGFLGSMQAAAAGTFRAELRALYSSDASVVAIHHGTAENGERTLDADAALLFEVSDGVVTAITVHQRDQSHWDAFFS